MNKKLVEAAQLLRSAASLASRSARTEGKEKQKWLAHAVKQTEMALDKLESEHE